MRPICAPPICVNPVRAGLVKDPKDYRWSGYGEAVAGIIPARAGLTRLMVMEGAEGHQTPPGRPTLHRSRAVGAALAEKAAVAGKDFVQKRSAADGDTVREVAHFAVEQVKHREFSAFGQSLGHLLAGDPVARFGFHPGGEDQQGR